MAGRFDYVKYDDKAAETALTFKLAFVTLGELVQSQLTDGRAKSLVFTKLEEAYMWVGKAIRDDQVANRGAELQESRNNE